MKNLSRDLSTFSTLITGNYVYVDKTEHIYNLYATGDRYHFLSRPRRFGKSLLISTLKELFSGNKELFNNLWISASDYSWQKRPVIHLDFSAIAQETPHDLTESLNQHLKAIADSYGLLLDENSRLPEEKLEALVIALAHTHKVVVLIDEYNYPLLGHMSTIKQAEEHEIILKNFYGVLKGLDSSLHAIFITGVSKFSKSLIFSGINNLIDISMSSSASSLLGFTDQEVKDYFHDHITNFAQTKHKTDAEIIHEMKVWYNGYRFSQEKVTLHNPFAILYYLKEQELRNYWYESGVPLLLVSLLYKQLESLDTIGTVEFDAETLDVFDINNIPLITLLFQTGYLTIKNYNKDTNKFILNYPNDYVAEAFKKNVIEALAHTNAIIIEQSLISLKKALLDDNLDKFCSSLQTLFAYIPSKLPTDSLHYFYMIFKFLLSLLASKVSSTLSKEKEALVCTLTTHFYNYRGKIFFNKADGEVDQIMRQNITSLKSINEPHKKIVIFALLCTQTPDGVKIDYKTYE
jgi:hypothetical protein